MASRVRITRASSARRLSFATVDGVVWADSNFNASWRTSDNAAGESEWAGRRVQRRPARSGIDGQHCRARADGRRAAQGAGRAGTARHRARPRRAMGRPARCAAAIPGEGARQGAGDRSRSGAAGRRSPGLAQCRHRRAGQRVGRRSAAGDRRRRNGISRRVRKSGGAAAALRCAIGVAHRCRPAARSCHRSAHQGSPLRERRRPWRTDDELAHRRRHRFGRGGRFPGVLELHGKLADGRATSVARYLPLGLPNSARDYVQRAILRRHRCQREL